MKLLKSHFTNLLFEQKLLKAVQRKTASSALGLGVGFFGILLLMGPFSIIKAQTGSPDAAVISVDSLKNPCPGQTEVYGTVQNAGDAILDSVNLTWAVDGNVQNTIKVYQKLDTPNGKHPYSQDTSIRLGQFATDPANDYNIEVWSHQPNGQTDADHSNDTATHNLSLPMAGNFTVGGSSPDYSGFGAALSDLKQYGLCGPVEINIRAGTYTGPFNIANIQGLSKTNTLDFIGEGASQSVITANTTGGFIGLAEPTINIDGLDYLSFEALKIANTGEGDAMNTGSNADHLKVEFCVIETPVSLSGFPTPGVGVFIEQSNDIKLKDNKFLTSNGKVSLQFQEGSGITVVSNEFYNWGKVAINGRNFSHVTIDSNLLNDTTGNTIGENGIQVYPVSTKSPTHEVVKIRDNEINGVRDNAIDVEMQKSLQIERNTIEQWGGTGIRINQCSNALINDNQLQNQGQLAPGIAGIVVEGTDNINVRANVIDSTTNDAIRFTNASIGMIRQNSIDWSMNHGINLEKTAKISVQNNMVIHKGTAAALKADSVKNLDIYHNSVLTDSGNFVLSLDTGNQVNVKNNNFKGGDSASIKEIAVNNAHYNANNYDHPNILLKTDNKQYVSLKVWQQGEPENNEVAWSKNAQFQSSNDLHLKPGQPFLRGVNEGIKADFDGDQRCLENPSVGADESDVVQPSGKLEVAIPDTVFYQSPYEVKYEDDFNGKIDWYLNGSKKGSGLSAELTSSQFGEDTVMMVISFCGFTDTVTEYTEVVAPDQGPNAKFFAEQTEIFRFDTVHFEDFSHEGVAGWDWDIQPDNIGGSPAYQYVNATTAGSQNADVLFLESGMYEMCLAVYNYDVQGDQRWDTMCKTDYLEVNEEINVCDHSQSTDKHNYLFDGGGKDGHYGNNENCQFVINPCTDTLQLTFHEFELESDSDYVRIYNGTSPKGEKLWDTLQYGDQGLTGDMATKGFDTTFIASSGSAYIEFKTNDSATRPGFQLEWESTGHDYKTPEAKIEGPDTVCKGFDFGYSAQSQTNNTAHVTHEWYVNEFQQEVSGPKFTFNSDEKGNDTLYLVTNECGLADTARHIVYVRDPQQIASPGFEANNQTPDIYDDVVTFRNTSNSCGKEVEWEIMPSGKRYYVNGTNSNSQEPQVVFQDTGCYDVRLIVSNASSTDTITKSCYIDPVNYCTPAVVETNSDIGISYFGLKDIEQSSSIGEARYTDFSGEAMTRLARGVDYTATVKRKTNIHAISRKIWIDYDQDGNFNDSNELVAEASNSGQLTWSPDIQVPDTVAKGVTRLRVGAFLQSSNDACGSPDYGEYEDYGVKITEDQTPPDLTLKGDDVLRMEACRSLAKLDTGAQAHDNKDRNLTSVIQVNSQADTAEPGTYEIQYSVTDNAGNTATKIQEVVVEPDTTKPQLTLTGNDPHVHLVNKNYDDPGYQATDNCSGLKKVDTNNQVNANSIGEYEVTYSATDSAGNEDKATRIVKVRDTVAPSVTLKGDDPYVLPVDSPFDDPGIDYSDNYWSEDGLIIEKSGSVDQTEVGEYELTYRVTDSSGNGPAEKSRLVVVKDTIAPEITPISDDTFTMEVFSSFDQFDLVSNVEDNYYPFEELTLQKQGEFFSEFENGKPDSLGTFNAELVYKDPSGNQASVQKVIEVVDNTAPSIQLVGSSFVTIERWEETPYVDSYEVSDNYYREAELEIDTVGTYFSVYRDNNYPGGERVYEIKYQAIDPSGNKSDVVERDVQVVENSTGIEETAEPQFKVYPNPTEGKFNLDLSLEERKDITIAIFNSQGKKVYERQVRGGYEDNLSVDLSRESAGIYWIKLQSREEVVTRKLNLIR